MDRFGGIEGKSNKQEFNISVLLFSELQCDDTVNCKKYRGITIEIYQSGGFNSSCEI